MMVRWLYTLYTVALTVAADNSAAVCNIAGTWRGHPTASARKLGPPVVVTQQPGSRRFSTPHLRRQGTIAADGRTLVWGSHPSLSGQISANTALNATAPRAVVSAGRASLHMVVQGAVV